MKTYKKVKFRDGSFGARKVYGIFNKRYFFLSEDYYSLSYEDGERVNNRCRMLEEEVDAMMKELLDKGTLV